jgi:cholesterol transport system auxiliary component
MKALLITRWHRAVVLVVLVSGCVTIEKSYPDKHYFVLEVHQDVNPSKTTGNGILEVADVRVSPRYGERSFVYRTSEARYESDFYNQFLVAPASLITEEIQKALARSHIFQHVIGSSSQLQPTHVLESGISALYGDFRDINVPKAILEIEFFLSQEAAGRSEIVIEKRYSKSVRLKGRSPEALVKGWNEALEAILVSFTTDLKAANLKAGS